MIVLIKQVPSVEVQGFCWKPFFNDCPDNPISGNREFATYDDAYEWVCDRVIADKFVKVGLGDSMLKKCPFCGAEAKLVSHPGSWMDGPLPRFDVSCLNRKCRGHIDAKRGGYCASSDSEEAAIKAWNKRVK